MLWRRMMRFSFNNINVLFFLYVFISKQEEEPEVTIKLTAVNPQKLKNVVRFDFNKMEFIPPKSKIYDLS